MNRRIRSGCTAAALVATSFAFTACEIKKSSNPLSPYVAGPIAGVNITAPKLVDPASGTKIAVDQQPVTLTVENATTNGVRPLVYIFEVASDAAFANKVFTSAGVAPGTDGRTRLKLPSALATEKGYYWRARAQDGANTGPFADASSFNVFTPIIIGTPVPTLPAAGSTVTSVRPQFVWNNAPRSGPVGPITYTIEIADAATFLTKMVATIPEQPNQTQFVAPGDLNYGAVYYWHVRAQDPTTVGPFTIPYSFATPAAPTIPTPTPTPTPGPAPPGGPAPNDAINLGLATIMNSPSDVASWRASATLQLLDLGQNGVHVDFTKKDGPGRWPDFIPPGWTGPLEYTLWIVLNVNGGWYASGCIEFWNGLDRNGGPPGEYARNWYFDAARWGPMTGHQPAPGEQVGFLVTAGDARNNRGTALKERSNVVVIPFPGPAGGVFRF